MLVKSSAAMKFCILDNAMPGLTRVSAAAAECAGTSSQEVATVQLKLNTCLVTNQSCDEDEEPSK